MDEVNVIALQLRRKNAVLQAADAVPPHVGHFLPICRAEPQHLLRDDAQTGRVVLFGMLAEQLHAQADAQHRLGEAADEAVQAPLAQVGHGSVGLSHAGEYNLVGRADDGVIIGQHGVDAQALHGKQNGLYVARVVVYYSN